MVRTGVLFEMSAARDFARDLEQASAAVKARAAAACGETSKAIATRAKSGAPKDRGDLQFFIVYEGKGLSWEVGIQDVNLPSRGGSNTAHQNPWVYGVWYEYGFVSRNIATRPYMRPAADAEQVPHLARMSEAVNEGLQA